MPLCFTRSRGNYRHKQLLWATRRRKLTRCLRSHWQWKWRWLRHYWPWRMWIWRRFSFGHEHHWKHLWASTRVRAVRTQAKQRHRGTFMCHSKAQILLRWSFRSLHQWTRLWMHRSMPDWLWLPKNRDLRYQPCPRSMSDWATGKSCILRAIIVSPVIP